MMLPKSFVLVPKTKEGMELRLKKQRASKDLIKGGKKRLILGLGKK